MWHFAPLQHPLHFHIDSESNLSMPMVFKTQKNKLLLIQMATSLCGTCTNPNSWLCLNGKTQLLISRYPRIETLACRLIWKLVYASARAPRFCTTSLQTERKLLVSAAATRRALCVSHR